MARKRLPPRDSKGRFTKRRGGRRRRRYRRNPIGGDLFGMLTDGTIGAVQVLTGKALARSVPDLAGMPREGNVGVAIQAAVAVGIGWAADQFLSRDAARMILVGGLTAPAETLIVAYGVPFLSDALGPGAASADVGAYVRRNRGMGSYGRRMRANPGKHVPRAGSSNGGRGVGAYSTPASATGYASGLF